MSKSDRLNLLKYHLQSFLTFFNIFHFISARIYKKLKKYYFFTKLAKGPTDFLTEAIFKYHEIAYKIILFYIFYGLPSQELTTLSMLNGKINILN